MEDLVILVTITNILPQRIGGQRVKENLDYEILPQNTLPLIFICGSISYRSGIYNGCKI